MESFEYHIYDDLSWLLSKNYYRYPRIGIRLWQLLRTLMDPTDVGPLRRNEEIGSAQVVGVTDVQF